MDTLWDNIEKLSAVCRAAGAHLPDEELKALQVGKVAEEAGEAMHALHGLKGLTTCGDDHTWTAGREGAARPLLRPDGLRTWLSTAPTGRGRGHVRHTSCAGHLLPAR